MRLYDHINKTVVKNILIGLLCFSLAFFSGASLAGLYLKSHSNQGNSELERDDQPGRINVLLLGMDARPGESVARTDTLILACIDRDTKKVVLISIPRDSRVQIPNHGWDKINAAFLYGGPAMTQKIVSELMGITIPYYMVTNFNGFQGIVDILGGVEINVDKRMYYPDEGIDLQPGLQRLNGKDALSFVRYRYDPLGDISRTERQQRFLTALAKEAVQMKTITKLPKLLPQLKENTNTNLGLADMAFLAQVAANIDPNNIATQTLPGDFLNINGGSYWEPDRVKAKTVVDELFAQVGVAQHIPTKPYGINPPPPMKIPSNHEAKGYLEVDSGEQEAIDNNATNDKTADSSEKPTTGTSNQGAAQNGTAKSSSGTRNVIPDDKKQTNVNNGTTTNGTITNGSSSTPTDKKTEPPKQ